MKNLTALIIFLLISFSSIGQNSVEPVNSEKKISNVILFNGLFGSSKVGVGIRYKSLYKINETINVGMGTGIESYSSGIERNFIPVSLEILGDVYANGKTPFYMLSAGYGIPLKEDEQFAEESKGGLMIDFSIGYRSKKHDSNPFVAVGYRLQNAKYYGDDNHGHNNKNVTYKRWSVSMGIVF